MSAHCDNLHYVLASVERKLMINTVPHVKLSQGADLITLELSGGPQRRKKTLI